MIRWIINLVTGRKPAYVHFSKHAYERWHCKEYDR